ncbi:MarR family winged helix-turn-helix transcriptional regulator [Sinomonas sp. G460-2]|uniref:MarR family winged helix-turn-helix transcriptional regulator n=1 Tax=Sinomonas sp. G460-2 TaxID=3393464 RepID=UPI0039F13EC2
MKDLLEQLTRAQQHHLVDQVMENEAIAREFGVSLAELQLLHLLVLRPDIVAAQQVVKVTALPSSTVSDMLERLERLGFVERQRDPKDRRRWVITLTEQCQHIAQRYTTSEMGRRMNVAVDEMTPDEIETVLRYFTRLIA